MVESGVKEGHFKVEEVTARSCADGMFQGDWWSHVVEKMRLDGIS